MGRGEDKGHGLRPGPHQPEGPSIQLGEILSGIGPGRGRRIGHDRQGNTNRLFPQGKSMG
jgi:hypothetical protein